MVQGKVQVKPYFSIIVPTLNEEDYLPYLLEDLKKQTYTDFEILVADGQSTDKTVSLARSFPKTRIINSSKRNVGYQRNLGAKNAIGKWLIFFDADTQIPRYFLEGIKYRCEVEPIDIFTTWMKVDSEKPPNKAISALINLVMESTKSSHGPSAFGAMMVCKKTVFRKIGGFDTSITFGEDSELIRRTVKKGYKYKLFRDPQFIFSLRRFRKEGTLKAIQKISRLDLDLIFNKYPHNSEKIYPMIGGAYYTHNKLHPLLVWFQEFSREMKLFRTKKLPEVIKKIFSE
jgi:glycosyltransferase involved in cell wall biosynthesis